MATPEGACAKPSLLHSKDHTLLLDTIDLVRSQGASRYVPLPQLIVCGDQSSGKSSVLEAVSGVRFPSKDTLCTRFATELVLRRADTVEVKVKIVPAVNKPQADKTRLSSFQFPNASLDDIPRIIEDAKVAMGIGPQAKAFSDDVVRIEVSGPSQPQVTLVDLPGVIHSANRQQTENDIEVVKNLVRQYMSNSRSIILAVVSARNDYANQIVTKMAHDIDPKGQRTLGIITKPDTLPVGSDGEKAFVRLAKNEEVTFRLGWHVLKNRSWETRECSTDERDESERDFFSRGVWAMLPSTSLGIASLRPRLGNLLKDQITLELPGVISDLEKAIGDSKDRLNKLGDARGTTEQQRLYLINASQSCSSIIKAAVDGNYVDIFFGDSKTDTGRDKRLRAIIQDRLSQFREDMQIHGHTWEIIEEGGDLSPDNPRHIRRADYIRRVRTTVQRSRGRELPGLFNPLIVGDLFYRQTKHWKGLAERHVSALLQEIKACLDLVLEHATDEATRDGLDRYVFAPALKQLGRELAAKLDEILRPHQQGHPITYNEEFAREVRNIRKCHARKDMLRRLNDYFGFEPGTPPGECENMDFNMEALLNQLTDNNDQDLDYNACSEATDCMLAYYKAALQIFIDNFATLAVESCLVEQLNGILTPDMVMQLPAKVVEEIAAEPEESQIERARATSQLETCEKSLSTFQDITRHKSFEAEYVDNSSQSNGIQTNHDTHPVAVAVEPSSIATTNEPVPTVEAPRTPNQRPRNPSTAPSPAAASSSIGVRPRTPIAVSPAPPAPSQTRARPSSTPNHANHYLHPDPADGSPFSASSAAPSPQQAPVYSAAPSPASSSSSSFDSPYGSHGQPPHAANNGYFSTEAKTTTANGSHNAVAASSPTPAPSRSGGRENSNTHAPPSSQPDYCQEEL